MYTDLKKSNLSLFLEDLVCGGGAAALSKTVVAPLERAKVVLQAQRSVFITERDRFKGLVDFLTRAPQEQGVVSLWRGNWANVLRIVPATAIRFPCYDTYKRLSLPRGEWGYSGAERVLRRMEAGIFAGLTTLLFTYPLDVAKTRLSLDNSKTGEAKLYKGVWDCLSKTRRADGFVTWYRGFLLAAGTTIPYFAVSFTVYDLLRDAFILNRKRTSGETSTSDAYAILNYIGIGTIAGTAAQLVTYPLDTIRKRLQMNGLLGTEKVYKSTLDCIKKVSAAEGVKGFYGGLVPTLLKIAPAAAIQFTAYDLLKNEVAAKDRLRI